MTRTTLALMAFVLLAATAYAGYVKQVYANGSAFTKNEAMVSALNEVNSECQRLGGITMMDSVGIEGCWYLGAGHHKCQASCKCSIP